MSYWISANLMVSWGLGRFIFQVQAIMGLLSWDAFPRCIQLLSWSRYLPGPNSLSRSPYLFSLSLHRLYSFSLFDFPFSLDHQLFDPVSNRTCHHCRSACHPSLSFPAWNHWFWITFSNSIPSLFLINYADFLVYFINSNPGNATRPEAMIHWLLMRVGLCLFHCSFDWLKCGICFIESNRRSNDYFLLFSFISYRSRSHRTLTQPLTSTIFCWANPFSSILENALPPIACYPQKYECILILLNQSIYPAQ